MQKKRTLNPTLVLQMRKLKPKYESDIRKDTEPFSSRASSQTHPPEGSSPPAGPALALSWLQEGVRALWGTLQPLSVSGLWKDGLELSCFLFNV